jgi:hypothetical protein
MRVPAKEVSNTRSYRGLNRNRLFLHALLGTPGRVTTFKLQAVGNGESPLPSALSPRPCSRVEKPGHPPPVPCVCRDSFCLVLYEGIGFRDLKPNRRRTRDVSLSHNFTASIGGLCGLCGMMRPRGGDDEVSAVRRS